MSVTPDNDCDACPNCAASAGLCDACYDAACVDRAEDQPAEPADDDCDDPEVTAVRRLLLWSWP